MSGQTIYGLIALRACARALSGESPDSAWRLEAAAAYPERPAARDKSCPRNAFRGLAEHGYLAGIPAARMPTRSINARYALEAAEAVLGDPALAQDRVELWQRTSGRGKRRNGQMDVVAALFLAGRLSRPSI